MIDKVSYQDWLNVFLKIHQIPVVRKVWGLVVIVTIYSFLVDWFETANLNTTYILRASSTLYGSLIMGLLLVFPTNSAYDRWWEGRKLWGQLVNEVRILSLNLVSFIDMDLKLRHEFFHLFNGFALALKEHLREGINLKEIPGFEDRLDSPVNTPLYFIDCIRDKIYTLENKAIFRDGQSIIFDNHLSALTNILGSCERIRNTPIAPSYRALLRHGIALNLLGLPWYLSPSFHIWSLPIVIVSSYFMLGIELVAEDVEQPFTRSGDSLPLDDICKVINSSLTQTLKI